jgi:hypothetical protein
MISSFKIDLFESMIIWDDVPTASAETVAEEPFTFRERTGSLSAYHVEPSGASVKSENFWPLMMSAR